jgi:hypothetical protein
MTTLSPRVTMRRLEAQRFVGFHDAYRPSPGDRLRKAAV